MLRLGADVHYSLQPAAYPVCYLFTLPTKLADSKRMQENRQIPVYIFKEYPTSFEYIWMFPVLY